MAEESLAYAAEVTPKLRHLARDLIGFSTEIGSSGCQIGDVARSKHARAKAMATVYAGAQQEHLVSVLTLEEAGQHRDAWLISRSMIEGMAQLTRATRGNLSGCMEWYGFLMVEGWRQMKEN